MLQAVIFDFDGVIVDTEPLHYEAFQEVLRPEGITYTWENYVERYIGFDDRDALRTAFRENGADLPAGKLATLMQAKADAFLRLVDAGRVRPYTGAVSLIRSLEARIPLALCSGALRSDIEPILKQLGIDTVFKVVVTAEDVEMSKPDPASYTMALNSLRSNMCAASCVAIEDTPPGIASAAGAGLRVLGVTNSYDANQLTEADRVTDSLEHVSFSLLEAMTEVQ